MYYALSGEEARYTGLCKFSDIPVVQGLVWGTMVKSSDPPPPGGFGSIPLKTKKGAPSPFGTGKVGTIWPMDLLFMSTFDNQSISIGYVGMLGHLSSFLRHYLLMVFFWRLSVHIFLSVKMCRYIFSCTCLIWQPCHVMYQGKSHAMDIVHAWWNACNFGLVLNDKIVIAHGCVGYNLGQLWFTSCLMLQCHTALTIHIYFLRNHLSVCSSVRLLVQVCTAKTIHILHTFQSASPLHGQ